MPFKVVYECDSEGCGATVTIPSSVALLNESNTPEPLLIDCCAVEDYLKEHTLWYQAKDKEKWNCDKCKKRQVKPATPAAPEGGKSSCSSSSSSGSTGKEEEEKQPKKRKIEEGVKQEKAKPSKPSKK